MPPAKNRPKGEYIETDTGNKVSRKAKLHGTQHIILGGRVVIQGGAVIRGDLVREVSTASATVTAPPTRSSEKNEEIKPDTAAAAAAAAPAPAPAPVAKPVPKNTPAVTSITIGRYSFISSGSTLKPPVRVIAGQSTHVPLKIGEHTFIGSGAMIEAASIGDHVHVGANAVIGGACILKDYIKILPGAELAPGMIVPSSVVVGGKPARIIDDIGDAWGMLEGSEGGDLRELWRTTGNTKPLGT